MPETRAPRNRTLRLSEEDRIRLLPRLFRPTEKLAPEFLKNLTINADCETTLPLLPTGWADLIIIDPPYNLSKDFHGHRFKSTDDDSYAAWAETWLPAVLQTGKPDASIYFCSDWLTSAAMYPVLKRHAIVRNRITWQREKGRGSKTNWKNSMEDIWFLTRSNEWFFDADAVKMQKRVIAPYRVAGIPKDWEETPEGNVRFTYPSNFWNDVTIPFWSMGENTDHPTQKPEKLMAKLILASCPNGGTVFDPFLGSGTTSVTAKKLGRKYVGIEKNAEYCLWAEARLEKAETDSRIQGFEGGLFKERNT